MLFIVIIILILCLKTIRLKCLRTFSIKTLMTL
nr:MAG TPA: hypothetical protein [Crassvirales sp.]